MGSGNGIHCSFLTLLKNCSKVVIPKIQRDYVQGREDGQNSSVYSEVRDNLIGAIERALCNNQKLVLDYIYGSKDVAGFFYPIDGQQRLTTLFLLHWYISVKENKLTNEVKNELKKFSYEVRDTAKEFCESLFDIGLDISHIDNLIDQIKNSTSYFKVYDSDPTIAAMLVMLEKIHSVFKMRSDLWDKLNNISFWVLSLEQFGLTDDLFVKMNARGKRLARFDTFKSDLESDLEKRLRKDSTSKRLIAAVDDWKINIDNEYLDNFWDRYGTGYAERNMFRVIMFFVKGVIAAMNPQEPFDDSWEINEDGASYKNVVKFLTDRVEILECICNIFKRFKEWVGTDDDFNELLISDSAKTNITHHIKVRLFGILYWWGKLDVEYARNNFKSFYRILCNYINSKREPNLRTRQYNSSIDRLRVGKQFEFIVNLIDECAKANVDFDVFICASNIEELKYEKEKLNSSELQKIKELEELPVLNRVVHNFFFDGKVLMTADTLQKILSDKNNINLCLRIILSFASLKYGDFENLTFDKISMQSGHRRLYYDAEDDLATGYCHRYFMKANTNGFGDKVLTSEYNGKDVSHALARAVRAFVQEFNSRFYANNQDIGIALSSMLEERLKHCDFSDKNSILWYIVKYPQFFTQPDSATLLVLRRKNYGYLDDDNVYDIRCTNEYFSVDEKHYQPFYLALCDSLINKNSTLTIDRNSLFITGNKIEYAHPCVLSNGWVVRIGHYGDWSITFNSMPSKTICAKYGTINGDKLIIKNSGNDCIERLVDFILECN